MSTRRIIMLAAAGLSAAGILTATLSAVGQGSKTMDDKMPMGKMAPAASKMTTAQKIANATSSAPAAVSGQATVMDWPTKEGAMPDTLRAGTNGWTCFPDMPETKGNDPMCIDDVWISGSRPT